MDLVGLGENSVDLVVRIPAPPVADGKQPITRRRLSPGGQVATTLCTGAALGLKTAYVGSFGDDEHGWLAREALAARGVDLSAAVTRPAPNRFAVILVDDRSGGRSIFFQKDPALRLRREEVPVDLITSARVVHLDATHHEAALYAAAMARGAGRLITVDVDGSEDIDRALVIAATHPIMAEPVPAALTGEGDLEKALRTLRQPHHAMLCVTLGERGSALLADGRFYTVPAPPVAVVDTTGAGDVFRGAFIFALLRGDDPEAILRFANAAASLSCTREGAIDAVAFHDGLSSTHPSGGTVSTSD